MPNAINKQILVQRVHSLSKAREPGRGSSGVAVRWGRGGSSPLGMDGGETKAELGAVACPA